MSRGGNRKRGAQPRQGGGSGGGAHWKWMLAGVALGWLSAFGVYLLKILPTAMDLRAREKATTEACAPGEEKAGKQTGGEDKPAGDKPIRIDFYDMLPKQQVIVPANGGKTTVATPPPIPTLPAPAPGAAAKPAEGQAAPAQQTAAVGGPRYLLQAGSFRTRAEADRRRAALTLSGFDVSVQDAQNAKGETWYRVMVGPFAGEAAMQKARQTLVAQKIDTLPVRVK